MIKRFKKPRKNGYGESIIVHAIERNDLQSVERIINNVGFDFSKSWLGGYALLCTAINYRQFEIASWLLAKGCQVNCPVDDDRSDTPLHLAVLQGEISLVECLLNRGACVEAKNFKGETALHLSCQKKNLRICSLLLNHSTVDIRDNFLSTPLHTAVEIECLEIVELLSNYKVNIDARTVKPGFEGFTALHMAVFKKNSDMVNILLKNGADIQAAIGISQLDEILENKVPLKFQHYTPLHLAIVIQNDDIIHSLLKCNADVNAALEHNSFTPLHLAVQNHDEKNVILLYENNANFLAKTKDGRSILHIALESDWPYLIEVLLSKNGDIDEQTNNGETLLFMAVEMGNENWVKFLLGLNASVNIKNFKRQSPLHIAAEFSEEIAKMLLDSGSNVDETDAENQTPLSIAVKSCDIIIVQEILNYKPSIHNIGNKSALIHASKNINSNYVQIIHMLLDYGFLWSDENINVDLLYYLISQGHLKLLEHLLEHGTDVIASMKNQKESSFIHKAIRNEDVEIIELLISHQFDLNTLDAYGKSAADYAIGMNNTDILELLLKNGAKINNLQILYQSLILSARNRNIPLFEKLMNFTNDVSISDEFGTTPLHLATWNTDYEFVQMLLNERACINTTDNFSDQIVTKTIDEETDIIYTKELKKHIFTSPLHIAVAKRDTDICTMFLECHANVNSRDGSNRTPLHIAAAVKSTDQNIIIKTLFNYGADLNLLDDSKKLPIYYLFNQSCVCSVAFQNHYDVYSECECDTYEENEINYVITTFVKHIVLLASMNKEVAIENYSIIQENEFSKNVHIACSTEISNMKQTKLYDHISFYDILSKKCNSLAALARNDDLVQAFETFNYIEKFPLYCDTIKDQFDRSQKRNQLLGKAIFSFNNLTESILPQVIVENIFDFLLFNDLRMVIAASN